VENGRQHSYVAGDLPDLPDLKMKTTRQEHVQQVGAVDGLVDPADAVQRAVA
jgi:hypothetical protein